MNMRKILVAMLALLMLASFAACASKDEEQQDTEVSAAQEADGSTAGNSEETAEDLTSRFEAAVAEYIDLGNYEAPEVEDGSISLFMEEYDTYSELNYVVTFGNGTSVQLPVRYQELLDDGWISNSSVPDAFPANSLTGAAHTGTDGGTAGFTLMNPTEGILTLAESWVTSVHVGGSYTESFTVAGSITAESTFDDVVAVLGEPYYVYFRGNDLTLSYKDEIHGSLEITIDADTGLVSEAGYTYAVSNIH